MYSGRKWGNIKVRRVRYNRLCLCLFVCLLTYSFIYFEENGTTVLFCFLLIQLCFMNGGGNWKSKWSKSHYPYRLLWCGFMGAESDFRVRKPVCAFSISQMTALIINSLCCLWSLLVTLLTDCKSENVTYISAEPFCKQSSKPALSKAPSYLKHCSESKDMKSALYKFRPKYSDYPIRLHIFSPTLTPSSHQQNKVNLKTLLGIHCLLIEQALLKYILIYKQLFMFNVWNLNILVYANICDTINVFQEVDIPTISQNSFFSLLLVCDKNI